MTSGCPKRRCGPRARRRASACVAADEDALARGEPVGLDRRMAARAIGSVARGRDAGRAHDVLREALRAFDRGGRSARPEDRDPVLAQRVGEPATSGAARPDDDELDVSSRASASMPRRPRREPDGNGRAARCPGLPGAQWSSDGLRALREPPRERMLAPARPTRSTFTRASLTRRRDVQESGNAGAGPRPPRLGDAVGAAARGRGGVAGRCGRRDGATHRGDARRQRDPGRGGRRSRARSSTPRASWRGQLRARRRSGRSRRTRSTGTSRLTSC